MDCKICLQKYKGNIRKLTPRMLTKCGHTMCESCIRKQTRNQRIVCPYDRKVTEVRNGVNQLPKNYAVLEMMEESKTGNGGVEEDVEVSGGDDLEDDEEEDSEDSEDSEEDSEDSDDSDDSDDSENSDISSDESSDSDDSVTRRDIRIPGFSMTINCGGNVNIRLN
ncbi:hypothetical protein CRE_12026 [Caenorhabditis remanei]|uniref:RING-type domain-containing protein n=1 Tax=Caenorhabditis remanei TaxID=31234 RepID=E3MPU6_CAERE|nr:hypothetical protein CRE_12026 [Caenorhabditis remanei]